MAPIPDIRDDFYLKITNHKPILFELWEPEHPIIVLGSSQKAYQELFLERCVRDRIPIVKRKGGGGAVLLISGILCITIAFNSSTSMSPFYFFDKINAFIIDIIEKQLNIDNLQQSGISDISIGSRKILGCSMFKSRQNFLYQGSLLVCPDLDNFSKYLRHPSREPDYRNRRPHNQFVSSFVNSGYPITVTQLETILEKEFYKNLDNVVR
jgi:lipoate-protein ligase A